MVHSPARSRRREEDGVRRWQPLAIAIAIATRQHKRHREKKVVATYTMESEGNGMHVHMYRATKVMCYERDGGQNAIRQPKQAKTHTLTPSALSIAFFHCSFSICALAFSGSSDFRRSSFCFSASAFASSCMGLLAPFFFSWPCIAQQQVPSTRHQTDPAQGKTTLAP